MNFNTNLPLDEEVSTFSTFLALEHISEYRLSDIGFSFGLGYTIENITSNFSTIPDRQNKYASVKLEGVLRKSLNENIAINLRPILFWSDPYHSFNSSDWGVAREDLSILVNLGVSYSIPVASKKEK